MGEDFRPIDNDIKIRKWRRIDHTVRRGKNISALEWTPLDSPEVAEE